MMNPPVWESSKENVVPMKQGRSVKKLHGLLDNSVKKGDEIIRVEKDFEDMLSNATSLDKSVERLDIYIKYYKFVRESYPTSSDKGFKLLERCTGDMKENETLKNEMKLVKIWIEYADMVKNPNEIFSFMQVNRIGEKVSLFWVAWAFVAEKNQNYKLTEQIFQKGLRRLAEPKELLSSRYKQFQRRMARRYLNQTDDVDNENNSNSNDLHPAVVPTRTFQSSSQNIVFLQNQSQSQKKNGFIKPIPIFCDENLQTTSIVPSTSTWTNLGSEADRHKENNGPVTKWSQGPLLQPSSTTDRQQLEVNPVPAIQIYVDEGLRVQPMTTPSSQSTKSGPGLSIRKQLDGEDPKKEAKDDKTSKRSLSSSKPPAVVDTGRSLVNDLNTLHVTNEIHSMSVSTNHTKKSRPPVVSKPTRGEAAFTIFEDSSSNHQKGLAEVTKSNSSIQKQVTIKSSGPFQIFEDNAVSNQKVVPMMSSFPIFEDKVASNPVPTLLTNPVAILPRREIVVVPSIPNSHLHLKGHDSATTTIAQDGSKANLHPPHQHHQQQQPLLLLLLEDETIEDGTIHTKFARRDIDAMFCSPEHVSSLSYSTYSIERTKYQDIIHKGAHELGHDTIEMKDYSGLQDVSSIHFETGNPLEHSLTGYMTMQPGDRPIPQLPTIVESKAKHSLNDVVDPRATIAPSSSTSDESSISSAQSYQCIVPFDFVSNRRKLFNPFNESEFEWKSTRFECIAWSESIPSNPLDKTDLLNDSNENAPPSTSHAMEGEDTANAVVLHSDEPWNLKLISGNAFESFIRNRPVDVLVDILKQWLAAVMAIQHSPEPFMTITFHGERGLPLFRYREHYPDQPRSTSTAIAQTHSNAACQPLVNLGRGTFGHAIMVRMDQQQQPSSSGTHTPSTGEDQLLALKVDSNLVSLVWECITHFMIYGRYQSILHIASSQNNLKPFHLFESYQKFIMIPTSLTLFEDCSIMQLPLGDLGTIQDLASIIHRSDVRPSVSKLTTSKQSNDLILKSLGYNLKDLRSSISSYDIDRNFDATEKEFLAAYFTVQMLQAMQALHYVEMIHCDAKTGESSTFIHLSNDPSEVRRPPSMWLDNWVLRSSKNSVPSLITCCLVDFGKAKSAVHGQPIDEASHDPKIGGGMLQHYVPRFPYRPHHPVTYSDAVSVKGYHHKQTATNPYRSENSDRSSTAGWSYEIDYFAVGACSYQLLFGQEMGTIEVSPDLLLRRGYDVEHYLLSSESSQINNAKMLIPKETLKRYWCKRSWSLLFLILFNCRCSMVHSSEGGAFEAETEREFRMNTLQSIMDCLQTEILDKWDPDRVASLLKVVKIRLLMKKYHFKL